MSYLPREEHLSSTTFNFVCECSYSHSYTADRKHRTTDRPAAVSNPTRSLFISVHKGTWKDWQHVNTAAKFVDFLTRSTGRTHHESCSIRQRHAMFWLWFRGKVTLLERWPLRACREEEGGNRMVANGRNQLGTPVMIMMMMWAIQHACTLLLLLLTPLPLASLHTASASLFSLYIIYHGYWRFITCADDVIRRRGYCDHFVTIHVCGLVWVCMLAW